MKGIGKIDTETLLLIGGGAVAVYMLTRPRLPVTNLPAGMTAAQILAQQQAQTGNSAGSIISAAGSALGSILTAISNF